MVEVSANQLLFMLNESCTIMRGRSAKTGAGRRGVGAGSGGLRAGSWEKGGGRWDTVELEMGESTPLSNYLIPEYMHHIIPHVICKIPRIINHAC